MTEKQKQEKPCAIYVRVSTQMQADVGLSIESQIETMKQEAERRGKPVYDIYNDAASGGSQANRPEFQRMLKESQRKPPPFDMILTWSISRFGRNTMESYIATEKLRERGISIFYFKEPFNDQDPVGNMVIQILRSVAEFSRLEYVKDVERSKTHLAKNGFSTGGPPPFGLRRLEVIENGKRHVRWAPNPETAPIARKIFQMYADGHGYKAICKWLNTQGVSTIRGNKWQAASFSRMLRNEIYIGNVVYNKEVKRSACGSGGSLEQRPEDEWVRCDGVVEPIVPREVFDRVQLKLLGNNVSDSMTRNSQYLLSGLTKCNVCGNAYLGRTPKKKCGDKVYIYSQYVCSGKERFNDKRDNVNLKRDWFDGLVVNRLLGRILTEANIMERIRNEAAEIEQAVAERNERLEELKKKKKNIEITLQKYYEAFEGGSLSPDELKARLKRHRGRVEEIDLEIKNIQNEIAICRMRKDSGLETLLKVDFKRMRGMFDALTFERQKEFLRTFIEKVVIDPEWFEIHYVLPSGMGVEHLLFEGDEDDGNGMGGNRNGRKRGAAQGEKTDSASGNGNKAARRLVSTTPCKILTCGNGVSDKNPGQNSVSNFSRQDDGALRLSAYRKSRKNAGATATAPENTKIKNQQETKPISAIADQQSAAHHSSYGKNGEGGIRTHVDASAKSVFETDAFSLSATSPDGKTTLYL